MAGRANGESSRKRMRFESDDEEIIAITTSRATSSRENDPRKRVRLQNGGPSDRASTDSGRHGSTSDEIEHGNEDEAQFEDGDEDEDEDEDEDIDMVRSVNGDAAPPATQYEEIRDQGFEHLRFQNEDDERFSQRLNSRLTIVGDNHIAENGILESVECVNFMCHERLVCELGPLLNFIVGENGSGKSAILTAITLCLGGKTSSTNRGASLKTFVKQGKEQSVLIVKIKNKGEDAYQHDIFGDTVIVERHFSRSGTSGFKLKSAAGALISNKKTDVSEVVEYFCLQVDNPLSVLSQDNARQFLNAASDAQKYRFFVEGVQLEQLDQDYRLITEFLDSTESKLPEQQQWVKVTKQEADRTKKVVDAMNQNETLKSQQKVYYHQHAWLQVRDQEGMLVEREQAVEEGEARIREAEENAERCSEAFANADAKYTKQKAALDELEEDSASFDDEEATAIELYKDAKEALQKIRGEERDAHGRLDDAGKRREENRAKIEKEKRLMAASQGGELAKKRAEQDAQLEVLKEIQQKSSDNKAKLASLQSQKEAERGELGKAQRAFDAKSRDVSDMEKTLANLERSSGSPLDAYPPRTKELLHMISKDKGFREKPIGPVGATISVLKPQWASLLEATLGRHLNSFVVSNPADQKRLQDMMRRLGVKGMPIMIGNRGLLDPRGHEPDANFDTIMRVLRFESDRARDHLIITTSIEQILLIEKREDAEKVMFNGPAPRNVRACLCFHDSKRGQGLRLVSARGGTSLATTPVVPKTLKPRMKADKQSQIMEQRQIVDQLKVELEEAKRRLSELQGKVRDCEDAIRQHKPKDAELAKRERMCRADLIEIERALDSFEGYDERLTALEEAGKELEEEYEQYGHQYGNLQVAKEQQSSKVEGFKADLDLKRREKEEHTAKLNKQKKATSMSADGRLLALTQKNEAFEAIDLRKQEKRRHERSLADQQQTVEQFKEMAARIVPERVFIPEDTTKAMLERKMEAIEQQLAASQKRIGKSVQEVHDEAEAANHAYMQAFQACKGTEAVANQLREATQMRLAKWRYFQRFISANTRCNFRYLMSERNFLGKLLLDHMGRKLHIEVQPNSDDTNGTTRNTKTLSGGEKSFSSICLLLSIWESMGSPLRCLDEFDVFMDNVNRAISTNMLVTAARRAVSRQFIMITPNAIEGRAKADKDVKIIRLTDPRQRTMNGYVVNGQS